jgi:hypothetical protein
MEQCIDTFSLFGGLNIPLNLDIDTETLITQHILKKHAQLYKSIIELVGYDEDSLHLLSAIAIGDRRTHSSFKRAHLSSMRGNIALDLLVKNKIVSIEFSRETPVKKLYPKQRLKREISRHTISHKIRFTNPFLRFWFYFISPNYEAVQDGNFDIVLDLYNQHKHSFSGYIFEELSNILLYQQSDFKIIYSGSYWDRQVEIDILAITQDYGVVVGECKWKNHKINRKELHKLQEKCEKIKINPDYITLFSKRGFSNELLHLKDEKLRLYSAEDFKSLLLHIRKEEILNSIF